jgi:hypothetical protein
MKKRALLLTLFVGLMAGTALQAQVNLYITGSTAFRANAYRSIRTLYGANLASQNPADPASSANRITWTGTIPALFGGQTVTIRANYSGSVEGIQSLTANLNEVFFASATPGVTTLVTNKADLAFSDVFQESTPYQAPGLLPAGIGNQVGVIPFVYVRSAGTPGTVNNLSRAQARTLLANGLDALMTFTGNVADAAKLIYLVGRYNLSGTRYTQEYCADFFPIASGLLYNTNGTSCTWVLHSGFTSGSGVVTTMTSSCAAVQPALACLGLSDANNAVAGGCAFVAYNGELPYTGTSGVPDFSPTRNGLYDLWGYQHLYYKSGASANVTSFHTSLKNEINTDLATSTTAIQLGTMNVARQADGGPVSP